MRDRRLSWLNGIAVAPAISRLSLRHSAWLLVDANVGLNSHNLADYVTTYRDPTGWWWNFDKYIVSLLKAYYGDRAKKENDWGFNCLPRVTGTIRIRLFFGNAGWQG
jgi:membrane-bound metal-dependent hydrolase YbcI (DUF457 family)